VYTRSVHTLETQEAIPGVHKLEIHGVVTGVHKLSNPTDICRDFYQMCHAKSGVSVNLKLN